METLERREEVEAALVVIQRNARIMVARLRVKWLRARRRQLAARTIQATLARGIQGRLRAAVWIAFVKNRAATTIQRTCFHGARGRVRMIMRRSWYAEQMRRATQIEACWRGYQYGRLVSFRLRLWAALELQRCARGFLGRLRAFRQAVFCAATDIQRTCSRGARGRARAERVYHERIEWERKRRAEEDKMVSLSVAKSVGALKKKLDQYMTGKGDREIKLEIRRAKKELRARDKADRKMRKTLDPETRRRMRVEDVFRSFDIDGTSATVPLSALPKVIRHLCLPLSESEIVRVREMLKAPARPGDPNDAVVASSEPDLRPLYVRFEEFWEVLSVELGIVRAGQDDADVVAQASVATDGSMSAGAASRLKAQLRVASAFRDALGRTKRGRAKRYLLEEAQRTAVKRARAAFRGPASRRPPFACPKCMRPFVFDYEVPRHLAAMAPDCERFSTYDQLRNEFAAKEKARREEELVERNAKEAERVEFERFRRHGKLKRGFDGTNDYYG